MCAVFGYLNYGKKVNHKVLVRLINELAKSAEIRGTDATGISYVNDGKMVTFKKAKPAHKVKLYFPKDTKALSWLASFNDNEIKTIKAAIEVNESQKFKLIKKAKRYYESFEGLTIAVLGLTFKPGTDDLREAPSLVNIPILIDDGAVVKAWDPVGVENFKKHVPEGIQYYDSIEDTLKDADLCMIFTEWEDVSQLDPTIYKRLMKKAIVIDGRNCYKVSDFEGTGIVYDSIGRKCVQ